MSCGGSAEDETAQPPRDGKLCWYVPKCPLETDCSEQAWKRAQCWSRYSETHVRDKLKKHLMTSGKHGLSKEEANVFAETAEIETYIDNEAPKTKKSVKGERPQSPVSDAEPPPAAQRRRHKTNSLGAIAKASAPLQTLATREVTIPVRASALASLSDSVRRAQHAAKQSKRLSEAGAACFAREEEVFGDVLKHIEDVVDEAAFHNTGMPSTASHSRRA